MIYICIAADHDDAKSSLGHDIQLPGLVLKLLPELGIDIDTITRQLEDEGVEKFYEPFDKLMKTLAQRPLRWSIPVEAKQA